MSRLGTCMRCNALQYSSELLSGTRKSFSPTVTSAGVRNFAA